MASTNGHPSTQLHLVKQKDVEKVLQTKISQRWGDQPLDESSGIDFLDSGGRDRGGSIADGAPGDWLSRREKNESDGGIVNEEKEAKVPREFSFEDPLFFEDAEVEDTCLVALATAYNAREAEGGVTKQELLQFAEECFKLPSKERLAQLKEIAQTTEKPELYLLCKVLRATGLTAKDANGLSDPYCRLGILKEADREKHVVKHKDLEDWQRERLVESIAGTTVKNATLEPEWDEDVYLSVVEPKNEMLALEVWDSDEEGNGNGSPKIKGIKGFGTYLAEMTIHKGDDFMGRVFYPLRSIPNCGEEKTLVLHSHSGKTQHGFVTLQLSIGAKRKKTPLQKRLAEFSALTRAVVNFATREEGNYVRRWSGELPPVAEKLLAHHAMLNDLDALQQTCIRLSILINYHKLYAVNMKAICDLIRKIKEHRLILSSASPQDVWKKQLFEDLNELSEEVEGVLMNHLSMFNVKSPEDVTKIEERVRTMSELYSFSAFTDQLPPGNNSLKLTLEKCVTLAVPNWFLLLDAQLLPQVNTRAEHLAAFKSLASHCLHQSERVFKFLNPIFLEAGVDYFSCFFTSLDKLLCTEAESRLKQYSQAADPSTFEIYCSFKDLSKMSKYVKKSMRESLAISGFHLWFRDMVKHWIKLATDRCKDYTIKAISADSAITVTDDVMFSSSAVDTTGFLLKIGNFWKHLEWPVASVAYGFGVSVMQKITECSLFYVGEVFKKLGHDDMFDENGRFKASEKLCIVLNNMQHIRQELTQFEEKLDLQTFYDWLEKEEKLGERFKELVERVFTSADDDIYNKMNKIMLDITEKLSPDIQMFVSKLLDDEAMNDDEAIDPLFDYLTCNLQTFGSHLFPTVFEIILRHMWAVSVDSVEKCLEEAPLKKGTDSAKLHQRLFTTLKTMREFYHCGGDGLKDKVLDSDLFMTLCSKLDILRLPTRDLTLRFFTDLAQRQEAEVDEGTAALGTLLVSVGYLKQDAVVEVDVIQGKGLPGLDKSGLSDPFVQLTMMPPWLFTESSHEQFKTIVHKQTLDPFFNESFKLPAKLLDMDQEGTVLLLSVFDHDIVGANDFAGMCMVACKDIPRLSSPEESLIDPDAPQRKNLTLPLFRYTRETPAFAELDARARLADHDATTFFKVNKKLLGHLSTLRHRLSSKSMHVK